MVFIRTLILSTSIIISGQALAESANQQALEKALAQWQPSSITTGDHNIIVALPGSSITSETYETVIMHGVCSRLWTKSIPKSALEDIQQLSITNGPKTLGYSFESPLSTCEEMGKLMEQPARIMLSSKTHLFSAKGK